MRLFLALICAASWTHTSEPCGEPSQLYCTSGGMIGAPLHGAAELRAIIAVTPAADGRFWAGIALNGDVAGDDLYAQAAIVNNIIPYREPYAPTDGPAGVILANGADHCCTILKHGLDASQPHTLTVSYDGAGLATMCVDGLCDTVHINLGASYVPELQCGGRERGEGLNPVGCSFTDIQITQPAPVSDSQPAARRAPDRTQTPVWR